MAETPSTMLSLGTTAPNFTLPDTEGNTVRLEDFDDAKGLVVAFICNHCPYVKHIAFKLAEVAARYQESGVSFVGISSNNVEAYPQDGPEEMRLKKERVGYPFPYLYDDTQEVAKAYRAACTPDLYLFDGDRKLVYRGQFDDSRPDRGDATGEDLIQAMDAVLEGRGVAPDQKGSIGCNIKWKPGNEPEYFLS